MKKILIWSLAIHCLFANFEEGMQYLGGSAGFNKDLESDETRIYLAPKFGAFVNNNFLIEGGLNYMRWEECSYDWNSGNEVCDDESEAVFGFGIKYFVNEIYFGVEFVPGISGWLRSATGSETMAMIADYSDEDQEMIVWKFGTLAPIAENIFLDIGLRLQKFLDSDIDYDGMLDISVGLAYFWKN